MEEFKFILITGLSGAGKTQAVRAFEDFGFYCIDNLPPALISNFVDLLQSNPKIKKVAVVIDIRGGGFFDSIFEYLNLLKEKGVDYQILFLEASSKILIQRFKEARLKHPLSPTNILKGIELERKKLKELREKADYVIDTTEFSPWDLKRKIASLFSTDEEKKITISLVSFGFKYGIPQESDWVLDVRFLPNPNYIPELQHLTGKNKKVKEYVLSNEMTKKFLEILFSLFEFLIPQNIMEGKGYLTISIGCTGGKHRSVVIAEELKRRFSEKYKIILNHRDVKKK
jgi:UPF0042 nucleotide-binding protein